MVTHLKRCLGVFIDSSIEIITPEKNDGAIITTLLQRYHLLESTARHNYYFLPCIAKEKTAMPKKIGNVFNSIPSKWICW
jgi:hypothetical protein